MASHSVETRTQRGSSVSHEDLFSNEGAPISSRDARYKRRAKNGKFAIVLAFLLAVVLVGTTFHYMSEAHAANVGRAAYFEEHSRYKSLVQKLENNKTEAEQLMTNCAVSVTDTDLCVQLESALDEAENIDVSGCNDIDPYEVSADTVIHESECLASKNKLMEKICKKLEEKIKPVHEAVAVKSVEDYKKILSSADSLIQDAHTLINETENQVVSASLWRRAGDAASELEKKLKEVRAADESSVRDYTAVTQEVSQLVEELRSSMDALRQDHERWVQEQELARARAQAAQQNTENGDDQNPPQNPDNSNGGNDTNLNEGAPQ